jgi:Phosphotransferase system mannitol/fructose-specific IIA domain (Ntr-type)
MGKLNTTSELMFLQVSEESKENLICKICSRAEEKGYVTSKFAEDLLSREAEFPTGLNTPVPIAIPHIGTNCNKSFFSFATLKKPIDFENMDGSEGMVPVRIVFLFGIVEPEEQVGVLTKISKLFQDKDFLEKIYESLNPNEALKIVKDILGGMVDID